MVERKRQDLRVLPQYDGTKEFGINKDHVPRRHYHTTVSAFNQEMNDQHAQRGNYPLKVMVEKGGDTIVRTVTTEFISD